jgi:hypothetical protein
MILIAFCSVYGDLNWYLQSRVAPTVRPRPLLNTHRQQQLQQQPSASLRSTPAPSLRHISSAFTPSAPHTSLRELGSGGEGTAAFALLVLKASGSEGGGAAAISEVADPVAAQASVTAQSGTIVYLNDGLLTPRCRSAVMVRA